MAKLSDAAARRIAEKYADVVKTTKVFTSGCTVCGEKGHTASKHG
jgi:hypothetical protein